MGSLNTHWRAGGGHEDEDLSTGGLSTRRCITPPGEGSVLGLGQGDSLIHEFIGRKG